MYSDSDSRWDHLIIPGRDLDAPRSPYDGGLRSVFPLAAAAEVVDALARGGAAVPFGALVCRVGEEARAVPAPPGWRNELFLLGVGPSSWRCTREPGEAWEAFTARSARAAHDALRTLGEGAEERAEGPVMATLEWTTEDEIRLFDRPAYMRRVFDRLADEGRFDAMHPPRGETMRNTWAGAVPGSFYMPVPAERVADVPADARFARVSGRARDLARLAERPQLEALELRDANETALRVAGGLRGLRVLSLLDLRAPTLDAVADLPAVEVLVVAGAARLRDASALARLPELRALWIDISGLRELTTLAELSRLRALLFTGGLTTLPTLEPLRGLVGLRHLYVGHVRVKDRSLVPLHGLTGLASLELPQRFPLEELAALSAALPHVAGIARSAFHETTLGRQLGWCPRCDSADVVFTSGMPVRTLCRTCDDAKIRKHALRWEMALAEATARAATPPSA